MIGFLNTGINAVPAVRLEAERVYLRPGRGRDWRAWAALRDQSRDFLTPWEPTWPADALSRRAYIRRLRRQIHEWRQDEAYSFLIFHKANHALLGGIGVANIRRGVAQMASLGYWIGQPHARQGYMTESVRTVVRFGFNQLGLHRIEAVCLPTNIASKHLLERVGFTLEGYARAYLRIDGAWQDHLMFAMLKEEFTGR